MRRFLLISLIALMGCAARPPLIERSSETFLEHSPFEGEVVTPALREAQR